MYELDALQGASFVMYTIYTAKRIMEYLKYS